MCVCVCVCVFNYLTTPAILKIVYIKLVSFKPILVYFIAEISWYSSVFLFIEHCISLI